MVAAIRAYLVQPTSPQVPQTSEPHQEGKGRVPTSSSRCIAFHCEMPINPLSHKVAFRPWILFGWIEGEFRRKLKVLWHCLTTSLPCLLGFRSYRWIRPHRRNRSWQASPQQVGRVTSKERSALEGIPEQAHSLPSPREPQVAKRRSHRGRAQARYTTRRNRHAASQAQASHRVPCYQGRRKEILRLQCTSLRSCCRPYRWTTRQEGKGSRRTARECSRQEVKNSGVGNFCENTTHEKLNILITNKNMLWNFPNINELSLSFIQGKGKDPTKVMGSLVGFKSKKKVCRWSRGKFRGVFTENFSEKAVICVMKFKILFQVMTKVIDAFR